MNEEQRKQRDARVAVLADAAVDSWADANFDNLRAEIRAHINVALDEQAKEIAAAIEANWRGWSGPIFKDKVVDLVAGFGDDR